VRALRRRARGDDVLGVRQRGRVEHDGPEAAVRCTAQQRFVGDVVQVQGYGDGGRLGERCGGEGYRGEPAAVEPHGVLADLADDRAARGFRPGDHGLGKDLRDVQGFVRLRTIKHLIKRCDFMEMRALWRTSRTGSCETWRHRTPGGARCWRC
jgi:hypothetical protein